MSWLRVANSKMNLDMMYEATRLTGDEKYAKIANSQADISATTHIRPDGTTYHVVDFNPNTGKVQKSFTAQGMSLVDCTPIRAALISRVGRRELLVPRPGLGYLRLRTMRYVLYFCPSQLSLTPRSPPLRYPGIHKHLPPPRRHLPRQTPLHRSTSMGLQRTRAYSIRRIGRYDCRLRTAHVECSPPTD